MDSLNFQKVTLGITQLFLIAAFFSCQSIDDQRIPDFSDEIDFAYNRISHVEAQDTSWLSAFEYFNNKGQLIEEVKHERRVKYNYGSDGKLKEKIYCREYNCNSARREILIYDDSGNHIGSFTTTNSKVDLDTVKFQQTKFYNDDNHLVKELVNSGTDAYGENYEYWKHYTYKNNRIDKEIETRNGDTVWVGDYSYTSTGKVSEVKRVNGDKFEIEKFKYDQQGNLIKESIENNQYELTNSTLYNVYNNAVEYKYNNDSRLVEKSIYNHKGDLYRRYSYKYKRR